LTDGIAADGIGQWALSRKNHKVYEDFHIKDSTARLSYSLRYDIKITHQHEGMSETQGVPEASGPAAAANPVKNKKEVRSTLIPRAQFSTVMTDASSSSQ